VPLVVVPMSVGKMRSLSCQSGPAASGSFPGALCGPWHRVAHYFASGKSPYGCFRIASYSPSTGLSDPANRRRLPGPDLPAYQVIPLEQG
jgi:hypothetical protein